MSVVLVFCLVTLIVYLIQSKYRLFVVARKLAGPWAIPLIGNVQMIKSLRPEYLFLRITENRRTYGKTYRLWLGTQLWVFLHTPEETRDALNDPTLIKAETFNQLSVLIGNGLLISHGKFWETHRRALGPAFHPNILNSFTEAISHHGDKFVEKLKLRENESVEVSDFIFPCILDIVFDTSMGKQLNAQDDDHCIYTQAFHSVNFCLFKRMVNPLLAFDIIFERTQLHGRLQSALHIIQNLMESVIKERVEWLSNSTLNVELTETAKKRKKQRTFLDTLLTTEIEGKPLSMQEIRDEVNTFVLAGVDTTAAAMGFILYALAKFPEEQEKLVQELNGLPNENTLNMADINSLEYLEMFIKECLRLYTIVPLTGRQSTADTKIGDKQYCAGITLWINMYGLAHDEQHFEEPYEFQPERFSRENQQKLPAFSYIPFSGGPHVCIGRKYAWMIMKILTVQVLQNFELMLRDPNEELILMSQMVLKSYHGLNIIFRARC